LNQGVTQISVERSTASNGTYQVVSLLPAATSYVDTNLSSGTTYYYRVRAINVATWSAYSSIAYLAGVRENASPPGYFPRMKTSFSIALMAANFSGAPAQTTQPERNH
jgi:hypothetical protein